MADTDCTHLASCPLFKVLDKEVGGKIFQVIYCRNKFHDCVRYQRSSRGESVPENLLPNGKMLSA